MKRKISKREKKFLLAGGIIALIIISYQLFLWYGDFRASIKEYSEGTRVKIERQIIKISEKEVLQSKRDAADAYLKELKKGLLPGDKPAVAQAELQRVLKEMAISSNIEIKLERPLTPVDMGLYAAVPVEIGFVATTAKLKSMLYKIKTSPFLLSVSEMKTNVTNINNPVDSYTTLVINGLIKKPAAKVEGKKS